MTRYRFGLCVTVLIILAGSIVSAAPAWPVYYTADGVGVSMPPDWSVVVSPSGLLVMAGPKAAWGRPVAAVSVLTGQGQGQLLMDRVTPMVGDPSQLRLLGIQQLAADREAKYYLRTGNEKTGQAEAYVMIGTVSGHKFSAVVVGIDPTSDPNLRTRAGVLQALLLRLVLP